jgi:hypothetical protein
MERPLLVGMNSKGHLNPFVSPSVDDVPGASNALDKGDIFVDSILKLGNFLGISVCNYKTEFVQNNFFNEYRKHILEQPLVRPALLTWEKGSENNKEHTPLKIFGSTCNQGLLTFLVSVCCSADMQ